MSYKKAPPPVTQGLVREAWTRPQPPSTPSAWCHTSEPFCVGYNLHNQHSGPGSWDRKWIIIRGMGEELISTHAQKDGAEKQVGWKRSHLWGRKSSVLEETPYRFCNY